MSNKIKIPLILVLLALSVLFYFTPHMAIANMKSAIEERNIGKLAEYVDFPAVRESLKVGMMAKFIGQTQNTEKNTPLAGLGEKLANALVEQILEKMITPDGVGLFVLLEGQPPGTEKNKGSGDSNKTSNREKSMSYEGFNRFVVSITQKDDGDRMDFVLHRNGLFSWKLTEIRFPD